MASPTPPGILCGSSGAFLHHVPRYSVRKCLRRSLLLLDREYSYIGAFSPITSYITYFYCKWQSMPVCGTPRQQYRKPNRRRTGQPGQYDAHRREGILSPKLRILDGKHPLITACFWGLGTWHPSRGRGWTRKEPSQGNMHGQYSIRARISRQGILTGREI